MYQRGEHMKKEEVQMMAFQLIGFAGDAFSCFYGAVTSARAGDTEKAEKLLEEGRKAMVDAHNAQNDLLAAEADGKDMEYSILMVHAQDHLTMALMYERLAQEFIYMYGELRELKEKLRDE